MPIVDLGTLLRMDVTDVHHELPDAELSDLLNLNYSLWALATI